MSTHPLLDTTPGTRYLVVDLEATCWQGKAPDKNEIIEIGAVLYELGRGVVDEFQTFIKPQLQPELSHFCKKLTSIRQRDVDGAPAFPSAFGSFCQWSEAWQPLTLASWGDYDKNQFKRDCQQHELPFPFAQHINLKQLFAEVMHCPKVGMNGALAMLKLELQGTHHRGIDDARNIARILDWLLLRPAMDQVHLSA